MLVQVRVFFRMLRAHYRSNMEHSWAVGPTLRVRQRRGLRTPYILQYTEYNIRLIRNMLDTHLSVLTFGCLGRALIKKKKKKKNIYEIDHQLERTG